MNRADRRKAQKKRPGYLRKKTPEACIKDICQNGITPQDLAREFSLGWDAGRNDTAEFFMRNVYAGMALALKRELGFDREQILRIIYAADHIIALELTTDDVVRRVSRECGIEMFFDAKKTGDDLFEMVE